MSDKMMTDLEYTAIRFNTKINSKVISDLYSHGAVSSIKDLTTQGIEKIRRDIGEFDLQQRTKDAVENAFKSRDRILEIASEYKTACDINGIYTVSEDDDDYPYLWRYISGMPKVIFARGRRDILDICHKKGACSIVGTRKPGRYALYATEEFTKELIKEEIVIVSGMALGIDRKAHETAIAYGGSTVAFMPCGADIIYPYQNKDIYERMTTDGLILSEMPPGKEVIKQYFPARNRLIAGLGDVTLIMEAGLYSGTLHTASFAANQGKDVFVLPNNIYSDNCHGGLLLLRDGAEVLLEAATVIDRIRDNVMYRYDVPEDKSDDPKSRIKDLLAIRPMSLDEIVAITGDAYEHITKVLTDLELQGLTELKRGKYILTIR